MEKITEQKMIKEALKIRGISQQALAERVGMKGQTNIARYVNISNDIGTNKFLMFMCALGYEVYIRDAMANPKEAQTWKLVQRSKEGK